MVKTIATFDHDFALQAVPQGERKGFWKMLVIMLGFTFFSASMWTGGTLGVGLTTIEFIMVVLAGNLILGLYSGLLGNIA